MTDTHLPHLEDIERDVAEVRRRLAIVDRKLQWVTAPSRIAELEREGSHLLDMLEDLAQEEQAVQRPPAA
jgi:hypothetical protein